MLSSVCSHWLLIVLMCSCFTGDGYAQPLENLHTFCGKNTYYCQPLSEFRHHHPGLLPVDPGIVELRGDTIHWTPATYRWPISGSVTVYLETADRHYHYRQYPPGQFTGKISAPHTGHYLFWVTGPQPLFLIVDRRRSGLSTVCYGLADL